MVTRIYRAEARPGMAERFAGALRETSIPLLLRQPGIPAVHAGGPREHGEREFVIVSVWKDLAAVERFAGPSWRQPVILPGDEAMVDEMEVRHYESA